jgi:hypothetical protein
MTPAVARADAELAWRGAHVTITVLPGSQAVAVEDGPSTLCLLDAAGGPVQRLEPGGASAILAYSSFRYPALLAAC